MSIRRNSKPPRIEVFRDPEFLQAYHKYIRARGMDKKYANNVIEIFKTLNLEALPIKLDTLESIRKFEEETLRDIDSDYTSTYFNPNTNSPEAIAEYKRIRQIFYTVDN